MAVVEGIEPWVYAPIVWVMSSETVGIDCGTSCGGGMESVARNTGEVDWEYAEEALAEKDEVFTCCAFVSCSKSDCDESNSNDKAGSETAIVVAS